jgi:hypothetical protein
VWHHNWSRLAAAGIWTVWILAAGVVFSGAWDQAIPRLNAAWLVPVGGPAADTSRPLELIVLLAITGGLVAFHWPAIVDLTFTIRELFIKSPRGPDEPAYTHNLYELSERVIQAYASLGFATGASITNGIYDRLQKGDLQAWGRISRGPPTKPSLPWPPRLAIPPAFWLGNTIEELDYWREHIRWGHHAPEITVTKPSGLWFRSRVPYYWDIVFDCSDARRFWPNKADLR